LRLCIFQLGATAGEIRFEHPHLGLVLHHSSFGLTKRFTKWARVYFKKKITFVNVRALTKPNAEQRPTDLRFYLNTGVRFDVSDGVNFNRNHLLNGGLNAYRHRRKAGARASSSAPTSASASAGTSLRGRTTAGQEQDDDCGDSRMHHGILA